MFHNAQTSGNSGAEPTAFNRTRAPHERRPYQAPRPKHQLAAAAVLVVMVALLMLL